MYHDWDRIEDEYRKNLYFWVHPNWEAALLDEEEYYPHISSFKDWIITERTWLTDSEGKDIYEGDFVQFLWCIWNNVWPWFVWQEDKIYKNHMNIDMIEKDWRIDWYAEEGKPDLVEGFAGRWSCEYSEMSWYGWWTWVYSNSHQMRVVGNVFENPDLLDKDSDE